MYRDIVVHVEDSEHGRRTLNTAVTLARAHAARLTGVALKPVPPAAFQAHLAPPPPALLAELDEVDEAALEDARRCFEKATSGLTVQWCRSSAPPIPGMVELARYADLAVIGQDDGGARFPELAQEVALQAGRPVLVVPAASAPKTLGGTVLVAWDGSAQASRALHDALPLLGTCERCLVLTVPESGVRSDETAATGMDIVSHLEAHGVAANRVIAEAGGDVGEEILDQAAEHGCDLVVMGIYGHTRLRELVFGGASRSVLEAMRVPVLMSH